MARFYGWSHQEIVSMPWRVLLAYSRSMPILYAEESATWLQIQHAKDPAKMQSQLHNIVTRSKTRTLTDTTISEWMADPYIRDGIQVMETLPTAEEMTQNAQSR